MYYVLEFVKAVDGKRGVCLYNLVCDEGFESQGKARDWIEKYFGHRDKYLVVQIEHEPLGDQVVIDYN